jgi:serine/threonine protein kinase
VTNFQYVALKYQDLKETVSHSSLREIDCLKAMDKHPNIIKLNEIMTHTDKNKSNLVFSMEFAEEGDLERFMKKQNRQGMPVHQVIDFAQQLLEGVAHMHAFGYAHRDLKPSNLLVGASGSSSGFYGSNRRLMIGDFGLSRQMS